MHKAAFVVSGALLWSAENLAGGRGAFLGWRAFGGRHADLSKGIAVLLECRGLGYRVVGFVPYRVRNPKIWCRPFEFASDGLCSFARLGQAEDIP